MSYPHCYICGRWDGSHSAGCERTGWDYMTAQVKEETAVNELPGSVPNQWVIEVRYADIIGRYHGGEYIDLYGEASWLMEIEPVSLAVINVWDYEKGESTVGDDPRAVLRKVAAWYGTIVRQTDDD